MTSQSINNLEELLDLIISDSSSYYIEQKSIVSTAELNGHTIHSRFKKFNGKITPVLLKQHLQKEINLAISLDKPNAIVYEYRGKHQEAFVTLISYYYREEGVDNIYITSYESSKIVLFLSINCTNFESLYKIQQNIEKKLENRLIKEWRVLPNNIRPDIGNLLILPREFIKR